MFSRLIEFSLFSFSYWVDMFDLSVFNIRVEDWERSLFQIGNDSGRWYLELFFLRLK